MKHKVTSVAVSSLQSDGGWKYEDKMGVGVALLASIRKFGQLRPLVVRTDADGAKHVLSGHQTLALMAGAGMKQVDVIDLGEVTEADAVLIALSLDLCHGKDFAKLSKVIEDVIKSGGKSVADVVGASGYTKDRVEHFVTLATEFDWAQLHETDEAQYDVLGGHAPESTPVEPAVLSGPAADLEGLQAGDLLGE